MPIDPLKIFLLWLFLAFTGCGGELSTIPADGAIVTLLTRPEFASLLPGSELGFASLGVTRFGDTVGVTAGWSSSLGSIDAGGHFVAPSEPGPVSVVAHLERPVSLTATSWVEVRDAEPDVTPTAGECDAPSPDWIWCDDFDVDRLSSYFEYNDGGGSFTRVAGVGTEGTAGMRVQFSPGLVDAGSLHLAFGNTPDPYMASVDAGTENYREIYWRIFVRNVPGWIGGGGDKLSRAMVFAAPTWAQAMIAHVWSGGSGAGANHLVIDPARGTDAAGALLTTGYNDAANLSWLGAAQSATALFDAAHVGEWHCVEAHIRLNDAGQSNGVFDLWIGDALEAQRGGLNFLGGYNAFGLNAIFLENYWNAGAPAAQERVLDRFVVSRERIGC
jgi:hypothetical protein